MDVTAAAAAERAGIKSGNSSAGSCAVSSR